MPKGKAKWLRGRGNNEPDGTDEARIIAVVSEANTSFAEGRFEQTCDCYTPDVQRQIEALVGAPDCVQAWTALHAQLRKSLSPEQFTALTSWSIASVELKGTTAAARYPALPASLRGLPSLRDAMKIRMRKIDGDWKIDSLPSADGGNLARPAANHDRSFITWGLLTGVLFPPLGIFLGIRLLVRDRLWPGLAVILTAVASWGIGLVIVLGQHGSRPDAQKHRARRINSNEVEAVIEGSAMFGLHASNVTCVAQSNSAMACVGTVSRARGTTARATYPVTLDTKTGRYVINTPVIRP